MKHIPVYRISDFRFDHRYFYANTLAEHIKHHEFIKTAHRHDFYLSILCTKGTGFHEIDFKSYPVSKGSLFMMSPGQVHNLKLSAHTEGLVFFHTEEFYGSHFAQKHLEDYSFFSGLQGMNTLQLQGDNFEWITSLFSKILAEYRSEDTGLKWQLLVTLTDLLYLNLSKIHLTKQPAIAEHSSLYTDKIRQFKKLIDAHYNTVKLPKEYAGKLHITPSHLNRICNEILGKSTTQLIADRVILEAKRKLIYAEKTIKEIADELGFEDPSYFIRFFKKQTNETPASFINRQKER
jgi:AraC family transcriptional activator of pobA